MIETITTHIQAGKLGSQRHDRTTSMIYVELYLHTRWRMYPQCNLLYTAKLAYLT